MKTEETSEAVHALCDCLHRQNFKHEICGALRRKDPSINLVKVAVSVKVDDAYAAIAKQFKDQQVLKTKRDLRGAKLLEVEIHGVPFRLCTATEEQWGAMTLSLTGSSKFIMELQLRAKEFNMRLNQYGLWHGQEIIAGRFEHQIMYAVDLPYIYPVQRRGGLDAIENENG